MPIEKTPKPELTKNYVPDDSAPIYVGGRKGGKPTDSWETVASAYRMNVMDLIKFNFKTVNSDEVNWYLRTRVGCRVASGSGNNWTFRDADPGMIYIPQLKIRFGHTVIEGNPGIQVDWEQKAKELEKMYDSGIWSVTGKILDVVGASDLALTFAEIGMPLSWGVGMSVASVASLLMAIGAPHVDAWNNIRKQQVLWGYSYGVLFGADKKKLDFMQSLGLDRRPINSPNYPAQEKAFQEAYRVGLVLGYSIGRRKMNLPQKKALFIMLQNAIGMNRFPQELADWTVADWRTYYIEGAREFRKRMLKR
ncbi:MAG: hypothetical protein JST93_02715 [Acidobacteria bacterium]|nr:hypothetical protein [Acidobacteriota bacterium]